jgi:hypothetical protein
MNFHGQNQRRPPNHQPQEEVSLDEILSKINVNRVFSQITSAPDFEQSADYLKRIRPAREPADILSKVIQETQPEPPTNQKLVTHALFNTIAMGLGTKTTSKWKQYINQEMSLEVLRDFATNQQCTLFLTKQDGLPIYFQIQSPIVEKSIVLSATAGGVFKVLSRGNVSEFLETNHYFDIEKPLTKMMKVPELTELATRLEVPLKDDSGKKKLKAGLTSDINQTLENLKAELLNLYVNIN